LGGLHQFSDTEKTAAYGIGSKHTGWFNTRSNPLVSHFSAAVVTVIGPFITSKYAHTQYQKIPTKIQYQFIGKHHSNMEIESQRKPET